MNLQPAHFGVVDLLAEQAGLFVHFFAFLPGDRGIEVWVGKLGIQGSLFLVPLGQFALQLLDLLDQRPALGEQSLAVGLGIGALGEAFGFLGGGIGG